MTIEGIDEGPGRDDVVSLVESPVLIAGAWLPSEVNDDIAALDQKLPPPEKQVGDKPVLGRFADASARTSVEPPHLPSQTCERTRR